MYEFDTQGERTLSFRTNEPLLYLATHPNDNNWIRATNARGKTGLIPINYVSIEHDVSKINYLNNIRNFVKIEILMFVSWEQYTGDVVMNFLDGAIRMAQRERPFHMDELLRLRDRLLTPATDVKDQVIELEDEIRRIRQIAISELGSVDISYVVSFLHELS